MRLTRQSTGQTIILDETRRLGRGGEAQVYSVPSPSGLAAKIYTVPIGERASKLAVMIANAPDDPARAQGHVSIAWPIDLLTDSSGGRAVVRGYLMPHAAKMRPLADFYNPRARKDVCPLFDYRYLHRAAANLASAMAALHARGYVVGDVNESNILISDRALVTLIDTDSFQVQDPASGRLFRCTVGKFDFVAPELQRVDSFGNVDRAAEHDLFGLAVLVFKLLMEGTHPFDGRYKGTNESAPQIPERIASGHFPHCRRGARHYGPKPSAPPFAILHPELQHMFARCFDDGHAQPDARPDAREWKRVLEVATGALVACDTNPQHFHGPHLKSCPWCARTQLLRGFDPFPSAQAVRTGAHLRKTASPNRPAVTQPTPTVAYPPPRAAASTAPKRRPFAWAAAFAALAGAIAFGVTGSRHWAVGPTATQAPQTDPSPSASQPKLPPGPHEAGYVAVNAIDGAQVVYVPAGEFTMGDDNPPNGEDDEKPAHKVYLDAYWIDKTPVTVAQYRKFCSATGRDMPQAPSWGWTDDNPIVDVTWEDASAYVKWAGMALPTEAQWEKAARGTDGRIYPWGSDWDQSKANTSESGLNRTEAVDARPTGASPYGALDMAGNVWQWCADWYDQNYYANSPARNPTGPASGDGRVLRGGSWDSDSDVARAAFRGTSDPGFEIDNYGFRGASPALNSGH